MTSFSPLKVAMVSFCLLLVSCDRAKDNALKQYIHQVKQRTPIDVSPINVCMPLLKLTKAYIHFSKNPFRAYIRRRDTHDKSMLTYPLSAYQFVGKLQQGHHVVALVRTPKGVIVAVKERDYIGVHSGQVMQINNEKILIEEVNELNGVNQPIHTSLNIHRSFGFKHRNEKTHV